MGQLPEAVEQTAVRSQEELALLLQMHDELRPERPAFARCATIALLHLVVIRGAADLLNAHLQDDVRMRAQPRALRGDLPQQGIESGARLALMDRIDPNEDPVHREQLIANRVDEGFVVNSRLCLDAGSCKRLEDAD
jgi:hypothetical protein